MSWFPPPAWPRTRPDPALARAADRLGHDFLWGVATSADQHEGGLNGPGQPRNNWAWAEEEGRVETIGASADFWNRAEEDFERCRELGLNAFRLSLSWPRIQPGREKAPEGEKVLPPPPFDDEALRRYAEILAKCREAGMEPIVTLHHFTHPAWLGLDAWLETETIGHYLAYVEKTVSFLLDAIPRDHGATPPRYYITVNEPNMLATCHYLAGVFPSGPEGGPRPAFVSLVNLLEAHVRAYRLVHRLYKERGLPAPMVTLNNYCSDLYWTDQGWLDLLFANKRRIPRAKVFSYLWEQSWTLDEAFRRERLPIRSRLRRLCGQALKKLHHVIAYACSFDESWSRLLDLLYEDPPGTPAPLDYIAIDYYDPFVAHALRWPHWGDQVASPKARHRPFQEKLMDSITNKWWDWKLLPEGLSFFVRVVDRFDLPILIAENGMANRTASGRHHGRRDNLLRSDYLRQHVGMVRKLKAEGWPLIGYLHWSLVDNYEWGTYSPRFGLYTLGKDGEREPVDFRGDDAARTYAEEIAAARKQQLIPTP